MKKKSVTAIAMLAGFVCAATSARAQTAALPADEGQIVLSISGSAQLPSRSFSNSSTFSSFGETARTSSNQNIGTGVAFDVTGGYYFTKHLGVGLGAWISKNDSAAAASVSLPDPLIFGRPKTINLSTADSGSKMKQQAVGVDIQLLWTTSVGHADVSVFLGPTFLHVEQDVATVTASPGTQSATLSTVLQTTNTWKAGNAGVDLTYRFTPRYGAGVFVRYAGGEVDLPAVAGLRVGGLQIGAGLRFRF